MARGGTLDPYDLVWLHEDDEVIRRVTENPGSTELGCGGVFTAVCARGKRDLLLRLLDAGIRVPPVVTGCHSYLIENIEMLRILLTSGMNPDLPNWQRRTFLHDLCSGSKRGQTPQDAIERARILLDAGASITARDEEYRSTPLAWAPGRTCRRWSSFCSPAAHPPVSLMTHHGPPLWLGPSGGDTRRSPRSCGSLAPPDKPNRPFGTRCSSAMPVARFSLGKTACNVFARIDCGRRSRRFSELR